MGLTHLNWLKKDQRLFLERGYLKDQTPEERYDEICQAVETYCNKMSTTTEGVEYVRGIADRFRTYVSKGWVSFATPVLANFGRPTNLPISCNISIVPDSMDGITNTLTEVAMLAKNGAGTAVDFSDLRPIGSDISTGGISNSILDWIELYADLMSKVTQGSTRRGFLTAYLRADHPEILDFLDIGTHRMPSEKQRFFQNITTAVSLPKGWLKELEEGDSHKRKVWAKILSTRKEVGYPYILDLDNSNEQKPQVYKDLNMDIRASNICLEIIEYQDITKTFACCLSSINLYHFDEFKNDPNFIFDMNLMLDAVIEEYIEKASKIPGFERAVRFAIEHRAIGLGTLAFHSYLQRKSIPFGSIQASMLNVQIFKKLREESDKASKWMALNFGEPLILKGTGWRNTTRLCQAPTKSTSFIMGGRTLNLSEGVEPHKSNYTSKKLAKIQEEVKNIELQKILKDLDKDTSEVWDSILTHNGSVQHLDFLNEHQKEVFKTFEEISQVDIIKMAADRQKYIDQGQSINIMIHPDTPAKEINKLHLLAFKEGLKGLYYQYSINSVQEYKKELMTCSSCEA